MFRWIIFRRIVFIMCSITRRTKVCQYIPFHPSLDNTTNHISIMLFITQNPNFFVSLKTFFAAAGSKLWKVMNGKLWLELFDNFLSSPMAAMRFNPISTASLPHWIPSLFAPVVSATAWDTLGAVNIPYIQGIRVPNDTYPKDDEIRVKICSKSVGVTLAIADLHKSMGDTAGDVFEWHAFVFLR